MTLDDALRRRLERAMGAVDGRPPPRPLDDARRLWRRVKRYLADGLVPDPDWAAIELACLALFVPPKRATKATRPSMRGAAAAEGLMNFVDSSVDADLIERTQALLRQLPEKSPRSAAARLLVDAINLDDFGIAGLLIQAMNAGRDGDGLTQVFDGLRNREVYGYWDARLKDAFHFDSIKAAAVGRLEHARTAAKLLVDELDV